MTRALPPEEGYAADRRRYPQPGMAGPPPGRQMLRQAEPGIRTDPRRYPAFDNADYGYRNGGYAGDNGRSHGSAAVLRARRPTRETQPAPAQRSRRPVLAVLGIMVLQAAISLILTASNTAFSDEANYLWIGHLELAHWFDGAPKPIFSPVPGAPVIYPPLGALASSVAGLAGARMLSLIFMLAATALLYSAASRLLGRRAAIAAAALWAVSVSALKLGAFATFDAMAVFFMCLAAWLVVQAGFRRRAPELAVLAGLTILVGNLTAYSYAIYDVPLVAFAFCVWMLRYDRRNAGALTLWLLGALVTLGFVIPTLAGLWTGIVDVTFAHKATVVAATYVSIAQAEWEWTGLAAVLGALGAVTAFAGRASRCVIALLTILAASAFIVPLYQLHMRTVYTLDEHLAYGIWLASMPAGYLIARVARQPRPQAALAALAATAALAFPTVSGWISVYSDYQSWPNATQLVNRVRPWVAAAATASLSTQNPGRAMLFTESSDSGILNYYTAEASHGPMWDTGGPLLSLDPANIQRNSWQNYFQNQLSVDKYRLIALSFPGARSTFADQGAKLSSYLAKLGRSNPAELGLYEYASDVAADSQYRRVDIVTYSDGLQPDTFIVWQWHPTPDKRAASKKPGGAR
jgi:Dolichyl-phosphate-mannose-protein mannosyltransferase